jgi:hypothetical protein
MINGGKWSGPIPSRKDQFRRSGNPKKMTVASWITNEGLQSSICKGTIVADRGYQRYGGVMKKHHPPIVLSLNGWLERAKLPEVDNALREDPYSIAYPTLIAHFASISRPLNINDALIGLHIVYGWMPTIPDLRLAVDVAANPERCATLLAELNLACSATEPLVAADAERAMTTVREFTNGSLIGASKLLHFLRPDIFPIWDSRVARRFCQTLGRPTQQRMRKLRNWREYFETLQSWKMDPRVLKECTFLRASSANLAHVSIIRIIELVLFHPKPAKLPKES